MAISQKERDLVKYRRGELSYSELARRYNFPNYSGEHQPKLEATNVGAWVKANDLGELDDAIQEMLAAEQLKKLSQPGPI